MSAASKPEAETILPDDVVLKVEDVANRLQIHPASVRKLIYEERLVGFRVGGRRLRTTERHLAAFLREEARRV